MAKPFASGYKKLVMRRKNLMERHHTPQTWSVILTLLFRIIAVIALAYLVFSVLSRSIL
jgi:hypothetical protein